ncbi:InlB B-repeat-containing protein [Butyrivibrio sp. FC2001]|uniref:InlB B-repeat-containing protein n=1 Tax=Butyrivibrio sp. FC2001 TaxID=1280671 RepID=UPI0004188B1F|nr:InlB B-repeat-containing protein [Butyrivibrio sp. FC2001]
MRKNIARKLAMLLALVVLVTTCGSDYNSISVRATSEEAITDSEKQVNSTEDNDYSSLFTEDIGDEQPAETEDVSEEPAVEETAPEEYVEPEAPAEEPQEVVQEETTEETPAEEAAPAEENADAPAEEAAPADEAPADEAPADEAPAQETPEEVPAETPAETVETPAEVRNVTVTYTATKGGKVSRDSETIDLNVEGAAFEGATATARSDKYEFVNWTDAEGNEVSSEATFVPANIEADATFTANFKAAENIADDMPALSVTDVHAGGLIVSISAEEGVFPKDTEVSITGISDDQAIATAQGKLGEDVKAAKGVDITFNYEGKEIQPADDRYVHVSLVLDEAIDAEDVKVLHDHEGEVDTIDATLKENADGDVESAEFNSNEFSIYIVAGTDKEKRLRVQFYNGTNKIAEMLVKQTDTENDNTYKTVLYDPGIGTINDDVTFRGWTLDKEYKSDSVSYSIDEVREYVKGILPPAKDADEADAEPVTFYAMFLKQYRVNYVDTHGVSLGEHFVNITENATGADLEQEYTVNMGYTPEDNHHDFQGWFVIAGQDNIVTMNGAPYVYDKDTALANETELVIKGDVTFSVNARAGNWLVFEQNGKGATYVAPQFIYEYDADESKTLTKDPESDLGIVMQRKGYTFKGWFEAERIEEYESDGQTLERVILKDTKFEFGHTLTDNVTVYAKWEADATAPYTIMVYKEDNGKKEFVTSFVGTGEVGKSIKDTAITEESLNDLRLAKLGTDIDIAAGKTRTIGSKQHVVNGEVSDAFTGFTYVESKTEDGEITAEGDGVAKIVFVPMHYNFRLYVSKQVGDVLKGSKTGLKIDGDDDFRGDWAQKLNKQTTIDGAEPAQDGDYYYFTISADYGHPISWPTYASISSSPGFVSWILMRYAKAYTGKDKGQNTIKGDIGIMDEQILGDLSHADGNYATARYQDNVYNWKYHIFKQDSITGLYEEDVDALVISKSAQNGKDSQHNPPVEGYVLDHEEFLGSTQVEEDGKTVVYYEINYYYNPLEYTISFMDGNYVNSDNVSVQNRSGHPLKTVEKVKYKSQLKDYYYEPTLPDGQEGYLFEGWYSDEGCTHPYDFNAETSIMPMGGVTVYAKWRRIEYRVFLHPNAGTAADSPDLSWGSDNQAMCFKVAYGEKISAPTGTGRPGFEFVGWFRDPGCTQPFNASAYALHDSNTVEYDKTEFTDEMDKWGNGATFNKDAQENRWWVTRKLDIYAKWRHVVDGAPGINVVYSSIDPDIDGKGHSGGESITPPVDSKLYVDAADAYAMPASKAPEGYEFGYWVMQKWNDTKKEYEDVTVDGKITPINPGTTYQILVTNARKEEDGVEEVPDGNGGTTTKQKYKYTIQLRAEYVKPDEATPTYIPWYENDGTEAFQVDVVEDGKNKLGINEAVNIQPRPQNAVGKDDYDFLGWAKVKMGESEAEAKAFMEGSANWTQNLTAADFLYYNEADNKFYADAGFSSEAKLVAADEAMPYQALFAVWKKKTTQYIINYYKDKVTSDNLVGTSDPVTNIEVGTEITLTDKDVLNKFKTDEALGESATYFEDGVQQEPVPYILKVEKDDYKNIIDVLYVRKSTSYTIEYYKGKELSTATHIGDEESSGNAGTTIEESDIDLDAKKPINGYKSGEWKEPTIDGANKLVLDVDTSKNVIKVLYTPIHVKVSILGKQAITQYNGLEQSTDNIEVDGFTKGYKVVSIEAETGYTHSITEDQIALAEGAKAEAHGTEVNDSNNTEYPKHYPMGLHGTPGESDTFTCSFVCNNADYEDVEFVLVEDGYLKITPVEDEIIVTIQGKQVETMYNGEEQNTNMFPKDGFDEGKGYRVVSIKYADGSNVVGASADDVALVTDGTDVAKGTEANTPDNTEYPEHYPMGLHGTPAETDTFDCSFTWTNYRFTNVSYVVEDGWLKINPSDELIVVTITGNNDSVYYNGKDQSVKGYTVDSITKDGEAFTKITADDIALVTEDTDVATGKDVKRNATTKAIESYMMNLHGTPGEADTFECSFKCTNSGYKNVTFVVHDGYITINPLELKVEVIGNRGEEFYDGSEKQVTGYTLNVLSGASNEGAVSDGSAMPDAKDFFDEKKVVFTGEDVAKGIYPDTYPMNLAVDQFSYDDPNIDVTFEVIDGQLVIKDLPEGNKLHVIARTPDKIEMYSGKTWVGSDFDYSVEGKAATTNPLARALKLLGSFIGIDAHAADGGKKITINNLNYYVSGLRVEVKARSVGKYVLDIVNENFKVVDESGKDVTNQFDDPEIIVGTLTITPKPIEITSASAEKKYDGKPLTKHSAKENTEWGIGDEVKYKFTGSQTEVGKSKNKFKAKPANDLTDFNNYIITYNYGTLKVTNNTNSNNNNDNNQDNGGTPSNDGGNVLGAKRPADGPAVLGAKRGTGDGPAVLGARRGGTDDSTDTSRVIVLLIAAGAVATLLATGKKRRSHEE